jgi:hypothetical protein
LDEGERAALVDEMAPARALAMRVVVAGEMGYAAIAVLRAPVADLATGMRASIAADGTIDLGDPAT